MKNFTFHKIIVIIGVMISFIGGFVYLFNNNSGQNHTQETHAPLLVKMDASWPRLYQNLSDLKHASDVVVEGSITGIKQQTVDQKIPYSDFNFQINQVIIDPGKLINGNNIIIHQTGGPETLTINGKSTQIEMEISDDPLMQVGDHLILFLTNMLLVIILSLEVQQVDFSFRMVLFIQLVLKEYHLYLLHCLPLQTLLL